MKRFVLDRRRVLRATSAGAVSALAVPVLDAMLNGRGDAFAADGAPLPRRFGVWFWGCGNKPARWNPATTGPGWTPSEELMPLAMHRDVVTVVSGTRMRISGTAHHVGRAGILTGSYRAPGEPNGGHWGNPGGPSIDQIVAARLAASPTTQTRFRSLELGVSRRNKGNGRETGGTSWSGAGVSMPAEFQPSRLFARLFGTTAGDPAAQRALEIARQARKSGLDPLVKDAADLRARLGRADQMRLDAHLDGLRAIERQLEALPPDCRAPAAPPTAPAEDLGREPLAERNAQMADLLTVALACDLTRVFSFQFSGMQTDTVYWQVGATEGMHVMTHDDRPPAERACDQCSQPEKVHQAVTFIVQQFAYLVGKLRGITVGAGTLLDQCCIVATSETSDATAHSYSDLPLLIAGSAGGRLRTGIHHRTNGENVARVMLSCMRAAGASLGEFGDGVLRTTEGLSALEL